mmetsp:Transcript_10257/g.9927  ORF Transcript_10257/g.9927 Transcript_10257/m.9927 type:complete len:210 (-) Transcript_10257:188-817(-)
MININYGLRQFAAVTFATTLAWDYCRAPETIESFSIWSLALHFVYFQLPLKSRALAFFHASSFIAANVNLANYLLLLLYKPSLELDHMELWEISYSTIIVRSFLINAVPLLFHSLDITFDQKYLILSYNTKPKKIICVWSLISYTIFGIIYDLFYPENEDYNIPGMERRDFIWRSRIITLLVTFFAFTLLFSMIIEKAHLKKIRIRSMS